MEYGKARETVMGTVDSLRHYDAVITSCGILGFVSASSLSGNADRTRCSGLRSRRAGGACRNAGRERLRGRTPVKKAYCGIPFHFPQDIPRGRRHFFDEIAQTFGNRFREPFPLGCGKGICRPVRTDF